MNGSRMLNQGEGLQWLVLGSTDPKHYRFYNRGPGKIKISWGDQPVQEAVLATGDSIDITNTASVRGAPADPPDSFDTKLVEWEMLNP